MSKTSKTPRDPYYQALQHMLVIPQVEAAQLFQTIVNAPFHDQLRAIQLDLGILALLLVNEKTQTVDRIALSDTESAHGAVRMSAKPFHKIKIPLTHTTNLIARALATDKMQQTDDWHYLFVPALTAKEARLNQAGSGIECSLIYPFKGVRRGAMIFSFYQPLSRITKEHFDFVEFYMQQVATLL